MTVALAPVDDWREIGWLRDTHRKEPSPFQSALIDWPDFWTKDRKSEDWLLEPLLPHGRAIATYSKAKVGKSLLALDVSARAATGMRVLGRPAGEPLRVVYFDQEMTEDDLAERLEDMGFGPDTDLSHLNYYLLADLPPLDTPEGGQTVIEIARLHNADLVVIDTLSRVVGGKENDSDTLRAFYFHTGLPLKADGRTVWRLDHAGKDVEKGQRGTSAKNDDVDLVWQLTVKDDDSAIKLVATHRRQSWVPDQIALNKLDGPLRHELGDFPPGTDVLAAVMDGLEMPLDISVRKAQAALKDAGNPARTTLISSALQYRRSRETPPETLADE